MSEFTRLVSDFLDKSVSHGTLRTEDLIESFYQVFCAILPTKSVEFYRRHRAEFLENDSELVVLLTDELEELAPYGYYFGTIEGDGADFGFWRVQELWQGDRLLGLTEAQDLAEDDGADSRW